jgi:hypothetical protein
MVGAAALVVATGVLMGGGVAYAATPGFEPDPDALGSLTFYDANGSVITGGSLSASPFVVYAAASGPAQVAGHNRAFLTAATPKAGVAPSQFDTAQLTTSRPFPNTTAPAPINTFTNPVATGLAGTTAMSDYITAHPNTETSAALANIYEIRLFTSATGSPTSTQYYRTDILVNPSAGTWSVAYPAQAVGTTTVLSASPSGSQTAGQPVTFTAHVTPLGTAGTVTIKEGSTDLGATSYNAATGDATLSLSTLPVGSHNLTATFTPADTSAFNGSQSNLSYTINPAGINTQTTLSTPTPPSGTAAGSGHTLSVNLSATVTAPSGTNLAGSVHFFDGAADLGAGTYDASTGVATLTAALGEGGHTLTATFNPTTSGVNPSTSLVMSYSVAPFGSTSSDITLTAQDNTQPFEGSLVLTVTITNVDLTQIPPTDPNGHPVDATDPTGHRHAWVFTGNLTGVSVNDTRPPQPGWTLTGQATNFVNGATTVSSSNLGWTPALASGGDAEGVVTAGQAVDSKLKTAASDGLHTSRTLAQAAPGNGLGVKNLSTGLELRIPDTSPTGTYKSTLTLTLVSP